MGHALSQPYQRHKYSTRDKMYVSAVVMHNAYSYSQVIDLLEIRFPDTTRNLDAAVAENHEAQSVDSTSFCLLSSTVLGYFQILYLQAVLIVLLERWM